jgi:hypothetical protein
MELRGLRVVTRARRKMAGVGASGRGGVTDEIEDLAF